MIQYSGVHTKNILWHSVESQMFCLKHPASMNLEVCLVATVLEVATVISVSTENLFFVFVIIVIISKGQ